MHSPNAVTQRAGEEDSTTLYLPLSVQSPYLYLHSPGTVFRMRLFKLLQTLVDSTSVAILVYLIQDSQCSQLRNLLPHHGDTAARLPHHI